METILSDRTHVARKTYNCDASALWNYAGYSVLDCKNNEQRLIVEAAEADQWKILPGQSYHKIVSVSDGQIWTHRARIGMQYLCHINGLFEE
jgi:hypothetical protein